MAQFNDQTFSHGQTIHMLEDEGETAGTVSDEVVRCEFDRLMGLAIDAGLFWFEYRHFATLAELRRALLAAGIEPNPGPYSDVKCAKKALAKAARAYDKSRRNRQAQRDRKVQEEVGRSVTVNSRDAKTSLQLQSEGVEINPGPLSWKRCLDILVTGQHPPHGCRFTCLVRHRAHCDANKFHDPDHPCSTAKWRVKRGDLQYACKVAERLDSQSVLEYTLGVGTDDLISEAPLTKEKEPLHPRPSSAGVPSAPPMEPEAQDSDVASPSFSVDELRPESPIPEENVDDAILSDNDGEPAPQPPPLPATSRARRCDGRNSALLEARAGLKKKTMPQPLPLGSIPAPPAMPPATWNPPDRDYGHLYKGKEDIECVHLDGKDLSGYVVPEKVLSQALVFTKKLFIGNFIMAYLFYCVGFGIADAVGIGLKLPHVVVLGLRTVGVIDGLQASLLRGLALNRYEAIAYLLYMWSVSCRGSAHVFKHRLRLMPSKGVDPRPADRRAQELIRQPLIVETVRYLYIDHAKMIAFLSARIPVCFLLSVFFAPLIPIATTFSFLMSLSSKIHLYELQFCFALTCRLAVYMNTGRKRMWASGLAHSVYSCSLARIWIRKMELSYVPAWLDKCCSETSPDMPCHAALVNARVKVIGYMNIPVPDTAHFDLVEGTLRLFSLLQDLRTQGFHIARPLGTASGWACS